MYKELGACFLLSTHCPIHLKCLAWSKKSHNPLCKIPFLLLCPKFLFYPYFVLSGIRPHGGGRQLHREIRQQQEPGAELRLRDPSVETETACVCFLFAFKVSFSFPKFCPSFITMYKCKVLLDRNEHIYSFT